MRDHGDPEIDDAFSYGCRPVRRDVVGYYSTVL